MIRLLDLTKGYGSQPLFEEVSFTVGSGERIGLVGRNGHGKTTLFRIILGEEEPDGGEVDIPADYSIGCLEQHISFTHETVLNEVEAALPEQEGGWKETHRAEAVMQGLGFSSEQMASSPDKLSGGFQIRVNLAKLLVSDANLLLLDEPTNYLDIVSIRWLSGFLRSWPGELMLITHDRGFMDGVVTHVAGIHRKKLQKVQGNTGKFYRQIEQAEDLHEAARSNQEKKRAQTEDFIRRFRAKATKASAVQSRVKALEREERLQKLGEIEELDFAFRPAPFRGKYLMQIKDLNFGYDEPLIKDLTVSIGKSDRVGVIGPNGKGKSTLLRLLASELEANSGSISPSENMKLAYFGQTNVQRLDLSRTIEAEILEALPDPNRTFARGICGLMMFSGDAALKKISVLSGGERSRVLLGKILASPANILLLDEPTNHLDMHSCEALSEAVADFPGAVLLVTHDEEMLRKLVTRLIIFDRGKVTLFEGTYDDFLRRVGWQDDSSSASVAEASDSERPDKKQLRKLRADINNRRSKELRPLKKRIDGIEEKITALEKAIEEGTALLIEASKDGFGEEAAKVSREVHAAKEKIEELFEELETTTSEHGEKEKEFQEELQKLSE